MANVIGVLKTRILRPVKRRILVPAGEPVGRAVLERKVQNTPVDPGIHSPCYKSFDDLIDLERLKSLDAYVTRKIEDHKKEWDEVFYSGLSDAQGHQPKTPGLAHH